MPAAAPALRRSAKVDIFGQVVSQQADDVVCMNCHRLINASRRASSSLVPCCLAKLGGLHASETLTGLVAKARSVAVNCGNMC